jgi:general secretion pathway protein I
MKPEKQIPTDSEAGFTLVETLVAFAILSLTLIVLFEAASDGARSMRHVEEKITALGIAQSKLAAVGHELPLKTGKSEGVVATDYRWVLDIVPYDEREHALSDLQAYRVRVSVFDISAPDEAPPLATLATARLGRPGD